MLCSSSCQSSSLFIFRAKNWRKKKKNTRWFWCCFPLLFAPSLRPWLWKLCSWKSLESKQARLTEEVNGKQMPGHDRGAEFGSGKQKTMTHWTAASMGLILYNWGSLLCWLTSICMQFIYIHVCVCVCLLKPSKDKRRHHLDVLKYLKS